MNRYYKKANINLAKSIEQCSALKMIHDEPSHLKYNLIFSTYLVLALERTYLQATITPDTFFLINLRILKAFLIFHHRNWFLRTDGITGCTSTALFFSFIQNWYFFHFFITSYNKQFQSEFLSKKIQTLAV